MVVLDKTCWEILNATADDWENLEQIYHQLCFDLSPEKFDQRAEGAYYLRPVPGAPLLQEIAERIVQLVNAGFLVVGGENKNTPVNTSDSNYVWRAWFAMTPEGKEIWASSDFSATV